jgi:hypothetical protein
MSERTRRIAENEVTFRRANEALRGDFRSFDIPDDELAPFLCECGDRHCTKVVRLSLDEYETVREDPNRFLIVPGHNDRETEQVVDEADHDGAMEDSDRYAVVCKRESVRDITERDAPRRG